MLAFVTTNDDLRPPKEPKLQFPMIPSDISKAKLIQHLIGTPAGLLQFTPTTENGLFSRELPYTYCQPPIWQDVFAEEEEFEMSANIVNKTLYKAIKS